MRRCRWPILCFSAALVLGFSTPSPGARGVRFPDRAVAPAFRHRDRLDFFPDARTDKPARGGGSGGHYHRSGDSRSHFITFMSFLIVIRAQAI